jgi:hypothetical protein
MRWFRRSKSPVELTDYRRVSDALIARRKTREQELPLKAQRSVRSYQPKQRLSGINERIREFVEHSKDTPRVFGPDWQDEKARAQRIVDAMSMALTFSLLLTSLGLLVYALCALVKQFS